jgi:hypothetical protein
MDRVAVIEILGSEGATQLIKYIGPPITVFLRNARARKKEISLNKNGMESNNKLFVSHGN